MANTNQTNKESRLQEESIIRAQQQQNNGSFFTANRMAGVILLISLVAILFVYGFAGELQLVTSDGLKSSGTIASNGRQTSTYTAQLVFGQLYIVTTFFVVLGFSFLFIYYKKATATGVFTVLFIVSFTILISPLVQKFWFNVFVTSFPQTAISRSISASRFFESSLGGKQIFLDFYNLKISLANSISQLVVILVVFGKLSTAQIIWQTIAFNILWNLNHILCILLTTLSPDPRIFDDYQITSVYVFGGIYGALIACFISNQERIKQANVMINHNASVMSFVGTFFLFLSFCGTTTLFATKHSVPNSTAEEHQRGFVWQQAYISSFFALSASVIFTYAFSILFNGEFKIHFKGSLVGTITGGIMYGCVAGTSINISVDIATGLFAGLVSALYYHIDQKSQKKANDSFGGRNLFLTGFLASFFIAPIVIIALIKNEVNLATLWGSNTSNVAGLITNSNIVEWLLIYVGISTGIGIVGGLLTGLLLRGFQSKTQRYFEDVQVFRMKSYGLRDNKEQTQMLPRLQSAQQLK